MLDPLKDKTKKLRGFFRSSLGSRSPSPLPPDGELSSAQDRAKSGSSGQSEAAIQNRGGSTRNDVVEGIKAAIALVEKASDMFPPLKTAAAIINQIITVADKYASNKADFASLEGKLRSLAAVLDRLRETDPPESLKRRSEEFAKKLSQIREEIESRESRSAFSKMAVSNDDATAVLRAFRDIGYEIDSFQMQTMIHVEVVVERMHTDIMNDKYLKGLRPANTEDKSGRRPCMDGTRQDVLAEVDRWINDSSAPNVLWISGYPGTGKSSLAMSIYEKLWSSNRLGSGFFFERDNAKQHSTANLWRQVAFDLSQRLPKYAAVVIEKLKLGQMDMSKMSANQIFRHLVEEPLKACSLGESGVHLPVIVIDALDECGGLEGSRSDDRKDLLHHLGQWSDLCLKVIVTSREEDDIHRQLSKNSCKLPLIAGESARDSTDINLYFERKFRSISNSLPSLSSGHWPGPDKIRELTERASGLFIWASTVIRMVEYGDPVEQLEALDQVGEGVYDLYRQILVMAFRETPSKNVVFGIKSLCSALILAKEPLQFKDIAQLLDINQSTLEFIRNGLRSVLENDNKFVRFSHQSFVDYLCDPACPEDFCFSKDDQSQQLGFATLRVLRENLRFNICNFPSSCLLNREVKDLPERMHTAGVTDALIYSCRFWASHVADSLFSEELCSQTDSFFDECFLFWLELLSLLDSVSAASRSILLLTEWVQTEDSPIRVKLKDARRFLSAFGTLTLQSAPHIYLSALPFSPCNSWTRHNFAEKFYKAIQTKKGLENNWTAEEACIEGHNDAVTAVTFSPDGKRVVSGSWDETIRIWDADTGELVSGPFKGHTGMVNSVAFSPDGKRVVSGSFDDTMCIWDADTGELVLGPFKHPYWVHSVAFSPDGKRVVTGSQDRSIRIWDADTGELVSRPSQEHSAAVTSVAFSPNGRRVVSGSADESIRIWVADTGELVSGLFKGHTGVVNSVAFSPDGKRIVSGSFDRTISIWDANTGQLVSGLFEGHTASVNSVAFSPNGKTVISGSHDQTIRIWDADGHFVSGPFKGHTDGVNSVAFSPNGKRVASGSNDQTTRIWDVDSGKVQVMSGMFEGHTDSIESVAFSPNGKRVASGSWDGIRIWDVNTGEFVSGPSKGHTSWVHSVAFSPNGKRIVSGSSDATICIWDADTGQLVSRPLEGHKHKVHSVSFSPTGERIVSGSTDETVCVWNADTGELVRGPFKGHSDSVTSVAFSPNGKRVVSGSHDKTIRVWDADTGELVSGPFKGHTDSIRSVTFSPNGKSVVSGSEDRTIRIWDATTGELVSGPFEGHTGWVTSVAFAPDGSSIVSGSEDRTVRIWDAVTGELVSRPFEGHTGHVNSIALSSDGKNIVSGSADQTIRIWDADMRTLSGDRDIYGTGFDDCSNPMHSTQIAEPHTSENSESKAHTPDTDDYLFNLSDGWIHSPSGKRLMWIPEKYRAGIWTRGTRQIISARGVVSFNPSNFALGPDWYKCYKQLPEH